MEVLQQSFKEADATGFPNVFLNLVLSPNGESSTTPGLLTGEPAGHVLLNLVVEVEAQFFVHFAFHPRAPQQ